MITLNKIRELVLSQEQELEKLIFEYFLQKDITNYHNSSFNKNDKKNEIKLSIEDMISQGNLEKAKELLKEAGAKRLIPLNVSGPFHTALLESASQKLAAELEKVSFKDFTLPLVGNTEAQIMKSEDVKALLARQVMEPVRFYDSIATIQDFGVDEVIEIGPGKVLSGFLKKIDKTLPTQNVEDQASLDALLNA